MHKKLLIFLLFCNTLLSKAISGDTISSPQPRCISVSAAGDVTITWFTPSDPNSKFNSYHIFSSLSSSGPFTDIDSIFTYAQTSYTDIGAGANTQTVYYFIKSRSGASGNIFSDAADTLRSIFLKVNGSGTGIASLTWNSTGINTQSQYYKVYREFPTGSGTWTFLDSTKNIKYDDIIDRCNVTYNYKIEVADASGCVSVSNIDGGTFQDKNQPAPPTIDTVSVDASGNAVISWFASSSSDTQGYIIYNSFSIPIDTVYGINASTYTYANSVADTQSETYWVTAFDSCGNISIKGNFHSTIYTTVKSNTCDLTNTISWSKYVNMSPGVESYNIYVSINGGAYALIKTNNSTTFSHIHNGINPASVYCYYITAVDSASSKSSTSNEFCVTPSVSNFPFFSYIKSVSVNPDNSVTLKGFVDTSASISQYKILRSTSSVGGFAPVGYVSATTSPFVQFTDYSASSQETSYYYNLVPVDSCGKETISSNFGKTILLTISQEDFMTNTLHWQDYRDWTTGVKEYNVYREINGVMNYIPFATIPANGTGTYLLKDNVAPFYFEDGKFLYYVEAYENAGNPHSFADSSTSNIAEVKMKIEFFIPNAFTPGGLNPYFQPKGSFVDKTDYQFYIFNRWGEQIFSTTNFFEGWDGGDAPEGVYVYLIRFKSANEEYFERKGTVTLIR